VRELTEHVARSVGQLALRIAISSGDVSRGEVRQAPVLEAQPRPRFIEPVELGRVGRCDQHLALDRSPLRKEGR
jgi:hypothetical protein